MTIAVDMGRKATNKQTNQLIQDFLQVFFMLFFQYEMRYLVVSKKKIHYSCEDGIEKSVPHDHCLSSFGKPRDAPIGDPRDRFFYPIPTLMMDAYNHYTNVQKYVFLW